QRSGWRKTRFIARWVRMGFLANGVAGSLLDAVPGATIACPCIQLLSLRHCDDSARSVRLTPLSLQPRVATTRADNHHSAHRLHGRRNAGVSCLATDSWNGSQFGDLPRSCRSRPGDAALYGWQPPRPECFT